MKAHTNSGIFVGIEDTDKSRYRQEENMVLTDIFIKTVKPTGKPNGDKYADGGGMYLLVKAAGKYWRFDYRFEGKRKTLALRHAIWFP